jgi:hypothetical protein
MFDFYVCLILESRTISSAIEVYRDRTWDPGRTPTPQFVSLCASSHFQIVTRKQELYLTHFSGCNTDLVGQNIDHWLSNLQPW